MNAKELFAQAIGQAAGCVGHVRFDQLGNATPCSEWNLKELLNHMVYELLWVPELLRGKTVADIGDKYEGDLLHSDIQAAWQHAADSALVGVKRVEDDAVVHLSYSDVPAKDYIAEVAGDILVHAWDVSRSLGFTLLFAPEMTRSVYENTLPRHEEMVASGLYGKPVDVPEDAPLQVKLLGLMGRTAEA